MNQSVPTPSTTTPSSALPPSAGSPLDGSAGGPASQGWWRRPRPVLMLLLTVVSLTFAVLQLLSGISTLTGPGAVSSSQIANEIQTRVPGTTATCADDLTATVGATTTCSVLEGIDRTEVRATVTAVDGDDVRYDLDVSS